MATPSEVSMQNLTGSWLLNKSLSDSFDQAFAFQGIPWLIRKLVNVTTLTLKISPGALDSSGSPTLIFAQAASVAIAGLSEEKEVRFLDGRETLHSSTLFGTSAARSRMIDLSTATGHDAKPLDEFLKKDFLEVQEGGKNLFDLIVHQSKGWVMEQIWGFGVLNGERRLMRKMRLEKGGEVAYITAWYDWTG